MTLHLKTLDPCGRYPRTAIRIYLSLGSFDARRGQRYNAHLASQNGEQIVTNALDIGYAACRALKARGLGGRMETWRVGSAFPQLIITDIDEAAEWTLERTLEPQSCPGQISPPAQGSSGNTPPGKDRFHRRSREVRHELVEIAPATKTAIASPDAAA